jgi:hypothetical protein
LYKSPWLRADAGIVISQSPFLFILDILKSDLSSHPVNAPVMYISVAFGAHSLKT